MAAYGDDVPVDDNVSMVGYTVVAALATSLDGITGDVTPEYLHRLEQERSDGAKAQRRDSPLKAVN